MNGCLRTGSVLAFALLLGGCSTMTGDFHQKLQIDAVDAMNRPVDGMQCQVGSGDSAIKVVTPARDVRVRRSAMSLPIECRRDGLVATATVKARRERMEEALLPFGSVGVFVDHLSGSLYSYPTALHLRAGQHVVLEHGGESQVASSEPIPGAPQAAPASSVELAALHPTPAGSPAASPAATAQKTRAASASARPAKTASSAAATPKPRAPAPGAGTAASPSATDAASGSGTPAAPVKVRSAPVNW